MLGLTRDITSGWSTVAAISGIYYKHITIINESINLFTAVIKTVLGLTRDITSGWSTVAQSVEYTINTSQS